MSDPGGSGRGPQIAVGAVVVLGLFTLYVAFGGPLPFIVEGGPALESVPSEADVVVYINAWSINGDTSQDVVDGILTVSNESLPGYSGPASLGGAFSTLEDTSLEPMRLRSVTAFGSYDEQGRVGTYQGLIVKTSWSESGILSAFGDGAEEYERRTYRGTRVFVDPNRTGTGAWVGRLTGDKYVIGSAAAVRDSIDAHEGRNSGINATLRRGFRSLDRGPVRFVSLGPDQLPGEPFVPARVARTVADIETIGGVYYPRNGDATVDLTVGTTGAAAAERLEPAVRDGLTYATGVLPERSARLLTDASVSRTSDSVSVTVSGPVDSFLDGYGALVESGLVNFLLAEPIGQPRLDLVPADATTVGYADVGLVTDPTTRTLFERLLTPQNGTTPSDRVFDGLEAVSTPELTSLRSVTVFASALDDPSTNVSAGAVVQAGLDRQQLSATLTAANVSYRRTSHAGRPVFVVTGEDQPVWIAPLDEQHLVVGTPSAVRDTVAVTRGERPALSGTLPDAMRSLPRSYVRATSVVPESVADVAGPLSGIVSDVTVVAVSYDSDGERIDGQIDLHFESESRARDARRTIALTLSVGSGSIEDEQLRELIAESRVSRTDSVVTVSARTDPETLLSLIERASSL